MLKVLISALALTSATLASAQDVFYFVAHAGPGDPYWTIQARGAADAAKKLGIKLIFSAPDRPGDIAKQVELLNAALSANPAGIATTIPDAKAFAPAVQRAKKKGIPLIAVNAREAKRDPVGLPYQAYVGMDERESGKRVGVRAVEAFALKRGDLVVVANHQPGVMSLELRTQGISEVLSSAGVETKTLDLGSNPAKAMTVIQSFVKANPKTRAILTLGPLGYTPVGKFLQDQKLAGQIGLGGFDVDPVGLDLIQKDVMAFTLDAQPYLQAFMSVTQLYLASRFGATAIEMNTGVGFLDKSNLSRLAALISSGYQNGSGQ